MIYVADLKIIGVVDLQELETGDAVDCWEEEAAIESEEVLADGARDDCAASQDSDTQRPPYMRGSLGFVSK